MIKNKKAVELAFSKIIWWIILLVFLAVAILLIRAWVTKGTSIADIFFDMF